jgi:uncharacterized protein YfdQ (DUF2303 family)
MDKNTAEFLLGALQGVEHRTEGGIPYLTTRNAEGLIETVSLERLLGTPTEVRQTVIFDAVDSFCSYLDDYSQQNETRIFVGESSLCVRAVVDYHDRVGARHGQHRAYYQLARSTEWATWLKANGRMMLQMEFAEFLEDNRDDITVPAAADLIEMAQEFKATKDVQFASSQVLRSGEVKLVYNETIKASGTTKERELAIPEQFQISLPIFNRGDVRDVQARFRFRIADGHLLLGYRIVGPERVERAAFDDVVTEIATRHPSLPMHFGSAEPARYAEL